MNVRDIRETAYFDLSQSVRINEWEYVFPEAEVDMDPAYGIEGVHKGEKMKHDYTESM